MRTPEGQLAVTGRTASSAVSAPRARRRRIARLPITWVRDDGSAINSPDPTASTASSPLAVREAGPVLGRVSGGVSARPRVAAQVRSCRLATRAVRRPRRSTTAVSLGGVSPSQVERSRRHSRTRSGRLSSVCGSCALDGLEGPPLPRARGAPQPRTSSSRCAASRRRRGALACRGRPLQLGEAHVQDTVRGLRGLRDEFYVGPSRKSNTSLGVHVRDQGAARPVPTTDSTCSSGHRRADRASRRSTGLRALPGRPGFRGKLPLRSSMLRRAVEHLRAHDTSLAPSFVP